MTLRLAGLHRPTAVAAGSLAALALLALALFRTGGPPAPGGREAGLTVHCAAGLQPPVEALAREYERRYGVPVRLQYGGSGSLLAALSVKPAGDLYVAGDASYVERARGRGLVAEVLPLAAMRPVIGVRRGNPHGIAGPDDLLREGLRVGLAHPEAAAVGRITREALGQSGHWDALERRALVQKPTVNELAVDLELGALDAAVIWDATAAQFGGVEAVRAPALDGFRQTVTLGVLRSSAEPAAALRLARFLSSADVGAPRFAAAGYEPAGGDPWDEAPELVVMSGAMLSPAVEETLREFEEREGVRVTRVYNGCGILVSQMLAGQMPDAYFSCDRSFLERVADRFGERHYLATGVLDDQVDARCITIDLDQPVGLGWRYVVDVVAIGGYDDTLDRHDVIAIGGYDDTLDRGVR